MLLLDPAVSGQRLPYSAGPNSPRHGSKTKESVFTRHEFPSVELDMKGYLFYFPTFLRPRIKIDENNLQGS